MFSAKGHDCAHSPVVSDSWAEWPKGIADVVAPYQEFLTTFRTLISKFEQKRKPFKTLRCHLLYFSLTPSSFFTDL